MSCRTVSQNPHTQVKSHQCVYSTIKETMLCKETFRVTEVSIISVRPVNFRLCGLALSGVHCYASMRHFEH